jgi:hypothetical protein
MLLGTLNRGMIFLASVLDTSVAFFRAGGICFYLACKNTDHYQKVPISFAWLDLSEVHFQVLEWVDSPLLDE